MQRFFARGPLPSLRDLRCFRLQTPDSAALHPGLTSSAPTGLILLAADGNRNESFHGVPEARQSLAPDVGPGKVGTKEFSPGRRSGES
jgi:hypothetical protein